MRDSVGKLTQSICTIVVLGAILTTTEASVCGEQYTAASGTLSSPGYPALNMGDAQNCVYEYYGVRFCGTLHTCVTYCAWTITTKDYKTITLSFNSINIPVESLCCHSHLEVYDGFNDSGNKLASLCGVKITAPVKSTTNHMYIKLTTSKSTLGVSFNAAWTTECATKIVESNSGNISSPKFPLAVGENGFCMWVISVDPGYIVELKFEGLTVGKEVTQGNHSSLTCNSNNAWVTTQVTLYDSVFTDTNKLLKSYCKRSDTPGTAGTIRTTGNSLTVTFSAQNAGSDENGFRAFYERKNSSDKNDTFSGWFEYGALVYDAQLNKTQKVSECVSLIDDAYVKRVAIGKRQEKSVHIHRDGKITFSEKTCPTTPDNVPESYICAYCTQIDHSGESAVFYSVYINCKKSRFNQPSMCTKATGAIAKYTGVTNFTPELILVVTWHDVKHQSTNLDGRSTFQTVIISNQDTTYALINYRDDKMNWVGHGGWYPDITIGIGTRDGGNASFQETVYSHTKEALRLDTFKGNTGRHGTWIFKLADWQETPEKKCNAWYENNTSSNTTRQQAFEKLPSCPCQFSKQRNIDLYDEWVEISSSTPQKRKCFQLSRSSSKEHLPYSKMCCYDNLLNGQWTLIGDPPNAGYVFAYNPSYPSLAVQHSLEDKEAHQTCCMKSPPASCQKFYELRPGGKCDPEMTIRFAWFCCDPRITTLDEKEYTFNGWGEYTMLTLNWSGVTFTLQGRTEPVVTINGQQGNATAFTAFGIEENSLRAFVEVDPNDGWSLVIYVNGTDYSLQFRNTPNLIVDTDDFALVRDNNSLIISFASGISLKVTPKIRSLAVSLAVPLTFKGRTRGLLGNYNGDKDDDFVLPDGTVLPSNITERDVFEQFGQKWQVNETSTVMRYGPRKGPVDFAHPDFIPIFMYEQSPDQMRKARTVCGGDYVACMYDFIATGDATIANDSKQFMEDAMETNEVAKNTVPLLVRLPSTLSVTKGDNVTFRLQGEDPDTGDKLSFHAVDNGNSMVQLNESTSVGTFFPGTDLQPADLRFYAVDSHGMLSPVRTIPVVMCSGCSGHGVCDFSTYVYTEDTSYNFRLSACVCQPAWDGIHCEQNRDACERNPCKRRQECTDLTPEQQGNSQVGYTCGPCPAGFAELSTPECEDVDECAKKSTNNCDMQCVNTEGSYQCICDSGYRLDGDGHTCWDINECQERSHNCTHICNNRVGGFACSCEEGFALDHNGASCTPEEFTVPICNSANCSQECKTLTQQSSGAKRPQCFCRSGYDIDPQDNKTCRDHDECNDSICTQQCFNYDGGFSCYCNPGFQLSLDKRSCNPCPPLHYGPNCELTCTCNGRFSSCHPVRGCQCDPGWTGRLCQEDVDECAEDKTICSSDQICANTIGSYTCRCLDGYTQNAQDVCKDIDECAAGSALNTCGVREECVNLPGGFYCTCIFGYQKTNGACTDIDECAAGTHVCEQDCVNVLGTYNCDCKYGYRLNTDRVTCSKVTDVCAEGKGLNCTHGCTLSDVDRAVCFCKKGYQFTTDQQSCHDINECTVGTSGCSHTCANTDGGYFCSCPLGMTLDTNRKTCVVCNTGTYGKDCAFNCACGIGSQRCDVISGCVCMPGWQGDKCADDVNECNTELVQQECQKRKALCENYRGGYRCNCERGYEKHGNGSCQDINECLLNLCDQDCENSLGGFRCLCYKGFTFNSTTGRCQDKNECEFPVTNRCIQRCINVPGSFVCTCDKKGYALNSDGVSCYAVTNCTRIDCPVKNGGCSKQENGTEECFCNSGYTILANNTCQLEDVRWCEVAKCDQGCEETPDGQSFICSCRTGYLLLEDRTSCKECSPGIFGKDCLEACTCSATNTMSCNSSTGACRCKAGWEGVSCSVDVNECTATPRVVCPFNSHCLNTIGSYLCPCDDGYQRNASGRCVDSHPCNCGPNANSCDTQTGICLCKTGFQGLTCSDDINECSGSPGVTCPSNSHCVNSQGSYLCSCDKGYQQDASGNCVQFKRQKVRFIIKDVSVNANDLADVKSMTYTLWKQATSEALTEKMRGVPGFKSVDVISLRVGSLIVEFFVVFDDVTYPTAVQKLAVVLVGLVGQSVTLQGQTGFLLIDLDDIQVGSNLTSCHVYKAIKPCPKDHECNIDRQLPQCRPKSSSPDQTTLIVALCVVIPVVIIVIVIVVCCVCKQKKCSKAKTDSYVDISGAQTEDNRKIRSPVPPAWPAAIVPENNYARLQHQSASTGTELGQPVTSMEHPYAELQAGFGSAAPPQPQMEIGSLVAKPTQKESILAFFPRPDSRAEHTYDTINHSEELAMTQSRHPSTISINKWTDGLTFETENVGN